MYSSLDMKIPFATISLVLKEAKYSDLFQSIEPCFERTYQRILIVLNVFSPLSTKPNPPILGLCTAQVMGFSLYTIESQLYHVIAGASPL
jgi:hypothetical protein